jgi:predicted 3-demethylubiquinone-9 3-methyltransferase (glyoxalase superfamily)
VKAAKINKEPRWKQLPHSYGSMTKPKRLQISMCLWLKDRYGLSWQVVPMILPKLLQDKAPKRARKVIEAMLPMAKIDIKALQLASEEHI